MDELIGKMLGPYKIVDRLGEGGMAVVYKGYQESLGRYVAIKVLRGELAHDQEFITRFRREALSAAKLSHPNILHVYDAGVAGNVYYIAMDYVEGGSLKDLITQQPLLPEQATLIAAQLADALDYAHRQGVIHRDIKPSNILMGLDGRPLITDFGIAKAVYEGTRLTRTGTLVGTPEYMAPEQAEGQPVDGRTDLYALGIVLYEMLTGMVPFSAQTPAATLYKQVHEAPPPVRRLNAAIPPWLEAVVARTLAKHPEERYQRAGEFALALRQASAGVRPTVAAASPPPAQRQPLPPPAQPAAPAPRRSSLVPILLALAGCLFLALLAGGAYVLFGGGDKATPEASPTAVAAGLAPRVAITSPANDTMVDKGQEISIQSQVTDDQGVIRVELWADGTLVRSDASQSAAGQTPFLAAQPWRADVVGSHTLIVRAYDAGGGMGESAPLVVHVQETGAPTAELSPAPGEPTPNQTEAPTEGPSPAAPTTEPPTTEPPTTEPPTGTPTPTNTPTATPTHTPTPTPTPGCAVATDSKLAPAWDQTKLGCPTAGMVVVFGAWEPFEHGYMLWREDTDWAYALHWGGGTNQGAGDWATGGNAWKWDGSFPDGHGLTPPAGRYEPVRGFGFVWYNYLGAQTGQFGWATDQEKGFCVRTQPFEHGFIFRSNTGECGQFNWARDASFNQFMIAMYGDGNWKAFPW